ncbi:rna recognition motif 2 family protein [Stylonychia lemnae]|uniref:Rna recognition motif 2 family protein n=1 Tax=Stylonychia lemnae TaxID=5949 RepID=A0A078A7R8_STYLE|nr:rna recognition motif 2 family protein [Stylonychia lemnae]|eukprot:CDW78305.1 rna recognition motif 2 family protein [Stylonychia lemnae]
MRNNFDAQFIQTVNLDSFSNVMDEKSQDQGHKSRARPRLPIFGIIEEVQLNEPLVFIRSLSFKRQTLILKKFKNRNQEQSIEYWLRTLLNQFGLWKCHFKQFLIELRNLIWLNFESDSKTGLRLILKSNSAFDQENNEKRVLILNCDTCDKSQTVSAFVTLLKYLRLKMIIQQSIETNKIQLVYKTESYLAMIIFEVILYFKNFGIPHIILAQSPHSEKQVSQNLDVGNSDENKQLQENQLDFQDKKSQKKQFFIVKKIKQKGNHHIWENLVYRPKNQSSTESSSIDNEERHTPVESYLQTKDYAKLFEESQLQKEVQMKQEEKAPKVCYAEGYHQSSTAQQDSSLIPIPKNANLKENYKVVIPRSCKELGIKARNYSDNEIRQFNVVMSKINQDGRTSLMIKNIPNKYSVKMLKETIEMTHKSKYDFLYLPIDFQNKCNVGYAFINMKSIDFVKSFYLRFNGNKWEYFNSEKICEITYARLQGLHSLKKHFQTSSIRIQRDQKLKPVILN